MRFRALQADEDQGPNRTQPEFYRFASKYNFIRRRLSLLCSGSERDNVVYWKTNRKIIDDLQSGLRANWATKLTPNRMGRALEATKREKIKKKNRKIKLTQIKKNAK